MTKYILSSPKLAGSINLRYNEFNKLMAVEFSGDLTDVQYRWFLEKLPILESGLNELTTKSTIKIIKEVEEVTFEDFYEAFGNKEGRQKAQHVWDRMPKNDQVKAYMYIGRYNTKLKVAGTAKAYPATYLNQKRWED